MGEGTEQIVKKKKNIRLSSLLYGSENLII